MNGLVWKALRREWFLLRWIEWLSIGLRRGVLHGRWAVRDCGRWLFEGWGSRWIEWRWVNLAAMGAIVGSFVVEVLRPLGAIGSALVLGVSERDRKWLLPSITGTIGLLLLILLFLQSNVNAVPTENADRFVAPEPEPKPEPPPVRVVDVPDLRDPFAELGAPEPPPIPPARPPVAIEPAPRPVAPSFPELVDLALAVDRGATRPDWEPRLDDQPEMHVSSAARSIAPITTGNLVARADGWDRHEPRMFDPNLVTVAHRVREYALATASSTLVREKRREQVRQPPVEENPVVVPQREPEPQPVALNPKPPSPAQVRLDVRSPRSTVNVDEPCIVDIEVANVGGAPAESLVVHLDLPSGVLEHRLGEAIALEIGTLPPGDVRRARLVASAANRGRGTVEVRLLGDEIEASESTAFEVTPRPEPRKPTSPATSLPDFGPCCR